MDFYEVLDQVIDLLRRRDCLAYCALKRQFDLDDEDIEALKDERIDVHQLATDQDGKMLVWTGETEAPPVPAAQPDQTSAQPTTEPYQPAQVAVGGGVLTNTV